MKKPFFANSILVISLLTAILVAATEVPFWISFFTCVMIAWKFLMEKNWVRPLSPILPPIFGFLVFVIVYIQYRTLWGQEESTTIMLGLAAVTILNFSSDRDHQFLVLLGFIIVMIKAVFSIDLIWIAPSALAFMGLWLSLISNPKIAKFKFLFWHSMKSLPVMLLLFFLFPRIVIFQTNNIQKKIAKIGISEDLKPGDIEQIVGQNSLAFRAEFLSQFYLQTNELYWRGVVLTGSNNLEWFKDPNSFFIKQSEKSPSSKIVYKVVLEPSTSKLIYTLDSQSRITETNIPIQPVAESTFKSAANDDQQIQYTAISSTVANFTMSPEDSKVGSNYLQHADLPPRTKKFIQDLKSKNKTIAGQLKALKDFFSNTSFVYTLSPGRYSNMDEFLFARRKGFCGHFAASFATLARHLGIPARVVIGYQGGTYNIAGGFWKVSQKDAHAWTELGIDGQWQRVDPTQWVSPLRLSLGGEDFFSLSESDQILFSHTPNWRKDDSYSQFWDDMTSIFDSLNYKWTLFLLNFDKQTQLEFLKDLSAEWPTGLLFLFLIAALILTLTKRRARLATAGLNPISKLMVSVEFNCARLGIPVNPSSTPLMTLNNLNSIFDDRTDLIKRFGQEYESVIYQNKNLSQNIHRWKKEWKQFFNQRVTK